MNDKDVEIFKQRIRECERWMKEQGMVSLLVFAHGSNLGPATKSHGYMRYLCGWDGHQNDTALIIRPGNEPVLVVTNIFALYFSQSYFWIKNVRFVKAAALGSELAAMCGQREENRCRLGTLGLGEMPVNSWLALQEGIRGCEMIDAAPHFDELRLVKDAHQMRRHQQAAALCDHLFETLAAEIKRPRPAYQLQAELEHRARYAGAEFCMTWLTVGPQADYCRFFKEECERTPQRGDQVLLGIYLMLDGYWGHAIRTGTMGQPSASQQRVFDTAQRMWQGMLDALKAGQNLTHVHDAAEAALAADFPEDQERVFRFRHGHGLGHSYEDPVSSLAFPQHYDLDRSARPNVAGRAGMLFEIHPNLFVPGVGGAAIGDMVALEEQGYSILTSYPRHHLDWAA
ncbi:M24 family metallopeptidase [Candidimonas nitroreducens]|uniref:Peptidase M24 domain-containing protein n=1 Tax=Candidimonas nitroreducens TaxID=683354 RepID=A0A225LZB6_9BURK|nr:M24 family metallopeptidase [Candidimonas nitroreducens]OWT54504.1 hypothetical protein CEY11_22575 [Candidimonas nitroreducens]